MQQDPTLFAIDQLLRLLALGVLGVLPWIPVVLGTAYLHARWSRRG